jgi:hypothetical protein
MDLGKFDRILEQQKPYIFKNSKYLTRDPIGKMEIIRNFSYQTAKDYYHQWYRPELMGIFIIGDVDQKKAEQIIKKYFANIKAKVPPIDPPVASVAKYNETQFGVITDPELGGVMVQIYNRQPKLFLETGVNYKDYLTREFTKNIFQKRLNRILREQNTPLFSISVGTQDLTDNEEMYYASAHVKEDDFERGIKFLLTEIERVKQNGYPQAFIVEETNGPGFTNLVPVEMVEVEKPKVIIKPPPQTVIPNPQIETPKVKTDEPNLTFDSSVKYKIQLVALRDTRFFDAKMINHLGIIKEYKKPNNITAKVIGDYSENNVKQVLNEIRLAGFKDAYIVREVNGELIPVPGMK